MILDKLVGRKRQLTILLLVRLLWCLILGGRFPLDDSMREGAIDGYVGRRGRLLLSNPGRDGVIDAHGGRRRNTLRRHGGLTYRLGGGNFREVGYPGISKEQRGIVCVRTGNRRFPIRLVYAGRWRLLQF